MAPRILKFGTRQVSGLVHAPSSFSRGKELPMLSEEDAGRASKPACALWRRKNLLPLTGIETRHVDILTCKI
jgi:hypothetical protein